MRLRFVVIAALFLAQTAAAANWLNWLGTGGLADVGSSLVVAANEAGDPAGAWTDTHKGDLSGTQLRLSILSHDWGAVSQAEVVLSTAGNFDEYLQVDLRPLLTAPREGEWIDLNVPAGAWNATPEADWSTVNGLLLRVTSHAGNNAVVGFTGLVFMENRSNHGVVTIAFDDSRVDVYDHAFSLMQERGLTGTVYVIPELIGADSYMSQQQLYELHQDGWEIGAHGEHPLIWMSDSELRQHFRFASQWLTASGFGERLSYAYPNGLVNERILEQVTDWFVTGRSINPHSNVIGHAPGYRLGAVSVYPELAQETLEYMIDSLSGSGEWLIIVFHLFSDDPVHDTQFETARFEALLDYLLEADVTVMTSREAWNLNLQVAVCGPSDSLQLTPYGPGETEAECH